MNLLKVFNKYFIEVTSNYFRKTMVNAIVFCLIFSEKASYLFLLPPIPSNYNNRL